MPTKRLLVAAFVAASLALGARATHAMTISPPNFDFTVNPGDEIRDVLRVYNEDPFALELQPRLFNFTFKAGDETSGIPEFYPVDESRNGHELAPWITFESAEPFTVAPQERVNIPFTIRIPADAQPGGHFGAIHLGTVQQAKEGEQPEIGILAATSALVFVRVNGDVRDELAVRDFSADKSTYGHLPATFTVRAENSGTTHLRPTGNVFITDTFGRQVASLQVNAEFRSILPGGIRRFEATWQKKRLPPGASEYVQQWRNFAIGKYTATMVLNYGAQNQVVSAATDFWVFPWMVILTVLAVLVALILGIRYGVGGYNRMVIRRYEAMQKQSKS
jgi:hypothetical protein